MKNLLFLHSLMLVTIYSLQAQPQMPKAINVNLTIPSKEVVKLADLGQDVGGPATAPFRYGNRLYFTVKVPKANGQKWVTRLYSSLPNGAAQLLPINPSEPNVNAESAVFNADATRVFYAISKEPAPGRKATTEICYRDKRYDGSWGHFVKLPRHINKPGTTTTQPAYGYDFKLQKDVLFFSSNREGGKGGFDIWCCTVERDGTFGEPFNLASNSRGDDVTPFFLSKEQVLFFSSNGHSGQGGFDIYASKKEASGNWHAPQSLDQFNTAFDELFFSFHVASNTAYLSSNRPNAGCQNNPAGCPDFSIFETQTLGSLPLQN